VLAGGLDAEIGPEVGRTQAFLGKILEFGTATSRPHPHLIPALLAEQPRLTEQIAALAAEVLAGAR
jgi:hypothetical protein